MPFHIKRRDHVDWGNISLRIITMITFNLDHTRNLTSSWYIVLSFTIRRLVSKCFDGFHFDIEPEIDCSLIVKLQCENA